MSDDAPNPNKAISTQIGDAAVLAFNQILPKALISAIPWAGPALNEAISACQAKIQADRINEHFDSLRSRLTDLEREIVELKVAEPKFTELMERAMELVTSTPEKAKREYVAALVANGIRYDHIEVEERKYLLERLAEMSPAEIIILARKTMRWSNDQEFEARHRDVLAIPEAHSGSSQTELHSAAIRTGFRERLVSLGMIRVRTTGSRKSKDISPLGRALLREIGLLGPDDM